MTDTKVFRLLSSLSAYERKRFRKYLESPLHNEDTRFIKLYDLLLPFIDLNNGSEPKREVIAKKINPTISWTNQDYARLFSNFSKRIEGFLALENYYAHPLNEYTDLLEVFNNRRLGKYFPDLMQYVSKLHNRSPYRDGEFYLTKFRLEALHHLYLEGMQQRSTNKNLLESLRSLDTYYLLTKLQYCAAMLHYQAFLSLGGEVVLINEILEHCRKESYRDIPLLRAYYCIVLSLKEPEVEEPFQELKEIIFNQTDSFPDASIRELFAFAINYCINQINYGKPNYLNEIFELYQQALATNVLLEDGEISPWEFKNIVTTALRVKEYKWTEEFIKTYKSKIPKPDRENAYTFNMAKYSFYVKDYDQVLKLLQDVKYDDIFYQLDSKTLLMKTYYELGEYQPLLSLKESFRILLRRKKVISEQNRINYENFVRFCLKLFRADVKNKKKLDSLNKEIEAAKNVADMGWIKEKLQELRG